MKPHAVITELEQVTSRTEKEAIVRRAWDAGCLEFFRGARMAHDIFMTFGVRKVPMIEGDDETGFVPRFGWEQFSALAARLASRELTGNAARLALMNAAEACDRDSWNGFYRRILLKKLDCGLTETTINKVLKATGHAQALLFLTTEFCCQLAKPAKDHMAKVKGRKMIDPKLDGVRLLTILDIEARTVRQFTRDGLENENFKPITEALSPLLDILTCSLVLDGEIVSKTFQQLMTQVNRQDKINTSDAKLALFDVLTFDEFTAGISERRQEDRHFSLCDMIPVLQDHTQGAVYVIPKTICDLDSADGQAQYLEFNRECIAAGFEGIMIKDPDAPYEGKRSAAWLKLKPFITVDLRIVGVVEGTGKFVGMAGALECEGEDEGLSIASNVGTGLSDANRVDLWIHRAEIIGRIVEVEADGLTQAQGQTVWSLRFPRFNPFKFRDTGAGTAKF